MVDGSDRLDERPFAVLLEPGEHAQYGFKAELIG
jgi:hypothetical protein